MVNVKQSLRPRPSHGHAPFPPLPTDAFTKDGQHFDPSDDVWKLRKKAEGGAVLTLVWSQLRNLSPRMVHLAKLIVAARAPELAAMSIQNAFRALWRVGVWHAQPDLNWSDIDLDFASRLLQHGVTSTRNAGNDFAMLRKLYEYGAVVLQHEDFSADVYLTLKTLRAPGNAKGAAVREADPEKGHLTPSELELIERALGRDVGPAQERTCVWLSLETGRNALAYTLLTESDLTRVPGGEGEDGPWIYSVDFTRLKKRTESVEVTDARLERLARRRLPITARLGELLWSQRRGQPQGRLLWWLAQNYPEADLTLRMMSWARRANLVSPRTGQSLILNARRFRVTLATQAADQGASMEHIAALLDHEDLQHVKVYVDRSPRFLERIEEEIDEVYNPMLRRFRGEVVAPDEAARRNLPVIPGFASQLPLLDLGGIGACGHSALCKLAPPLTCYACEHFVAFRTGPHTKVVEALERAMIDMEPRIAFQLGRALAAAREVVALTTAPAETVE